MRRRVGAALIGLAALLAVVGCNPPGIAQGTYETYQVQVTLSGGATIPDGRAGEYYTTATLHYPGARPPAYSAAGSPEPGPSTQVMRLYYWTPGSG